MGEYGRKQRNKSERIILEKGQVGKNGFTDNRPEFTKQEKMITDIQYRQKLQSYTEPIQDYKDTASIKRETINNIGIVDKEAQQNPVQLFAIPSALDDLEQDIKEVKTDIGSQGGEESLYGSDEWAHDTRWAAKRKLDEWELVKELFYTVDNNLDFAAHFGFGINDTTEADGIAYNKEDNTVLAGENKIVSGNFSQIAENIDSALSQLCAGNRAKNYGLCKLIARISIDPNSDAAEHLNVMNDTVRKGMITRWRNKLKSYSNQAESVWSDNNELRLLIILGENVFFDEKIGSTCSRFDDDLHA